MEQGTNAALMRQKNEKTILSLINQSPLSRAEVAKRTGLTRAAVTIITDELMRRGLISEKPVQTAAVGRQPRMLLLNYDALYTLGINIARRKVTAAIADLGGHILAEERYGAMTPQELERNAPGILEALLQKTGIPRQKLYALGVVTPGPVDTQSQTVLNPPNFDNWHGVCVGELLKGLGLPIFHDNVSNGTALAEKYFGAAREAASFMALLVDTGIGSGIVLDNELFAGINEVGHMSIRFDGKPCECGNTGCLEKYAAIPAVLEGTGLASWQEAVDRGHSALEREAEFLSTVIVNINNLFNLERIVLCGDLSYRPEAITDLITRRIENRLLTRKTLTVCAGQVTSRGLAACAVAAHQFYH